jgi:Rieske Fe-S protein
MAVAYWTEQMAQDAEVKMAERKVEMLDKELQSFQDAYYKNKGGGNTLTW